MLEFLKKEAALGTTLNGAVTNTTSGEDCLDLFFRCGAMRSVDNIEIKKLVRRAFIADPVTTLRIIFYARDIRGGQGERRFFRIALRELAVLAPDAIKRNVKYIPEYGRYDDLLVLIGTPCEDEAVNVIKKQLEEDIAALNEDKPVSLLGKWLPSVNASSKETVQLAHTIAKRLGMTSAQYRKTLSALRKKIAIVENNLRESDFTFSYAAVPSCAMMKYRKVFIGKDGERYKKYIADVNDGREEIKTSALYPYDIIRKCLETYNVKLGNTEREYLDTAWRNLPVYGDNASNAIAVVDGSGSMYSMYRGSLRPIDAAVSLGIYFAEHNKGAFANHFITFSRSPRLVEIKGKDITEKAKYVSTFNEVANTNLEGVFELLLSTAVKNRLSQEEMPESLYIISDMEFDYCCTGSRDETLFKNMQNLYEKNGYKLPRIIFWNVNSIQANFPVSRGENNTVLISGASPSAFDIAVTGDVNPYSIMLSVINRERYACIS